LAGIRKSWYEREEAEKVTKDWVKLYCKITDRERELLEIINQRKMVRRDMLEIISPSYRNLGDSRTRLMNRSVNKLFSNMCIDKVHEKQDFSSGNTPAILSLDRAGSLILGIPHRQRIKHIKSVVNGQTRITRRLPANYRHIHGVNQLEVETILFCEKTGSKIIRWHHEKPQELHYGNEKVVVIPDIGLELKVRQKPFYAFIEYDTGSENISHKEPKTISDKVIKYKKYKLSKLWEKDYPKFPMLLLVTEDEKRTQFFNRKCKENGLLGLGIYYENYRAFLERLADKA
jgi:hypothetical protein